ncbi:MAG: hypothetical protein ACNYPE_17785 [Candidatus Azotimanducaceae bacterium WSBS_2022_MAG_OTU7]
MARYDYYCDANGRTIEVVHGISQELSSWGDLCRLANIDTGETDEESPVRKIITMAPMANTPAGNSELKNLGFTKLEKRYDGTYENVTRTGTEKRFLDPKDPSSMPHLHKKISD